MRKVWCSGLVMMLVVIVGAGPATKPAPPVDDTPIEKYRFSWELVKIGDFYVAVAKDQDTTCIDLRSNFNIISLGGKDAEAIGAALKNTDDMQKKMKAEGVETSESVKANKYKVTFRFSPENGFFVSIQSGERFALNSITLARDEANAATPFLLKATSLIKKVDEKIKP